MKSQNHPVILPVEVSVNCTISGAVPDVGFAMKFATGPGGAITKMDLEVSELL